MKWFSGVLIAYTISLSSWAQECPIIDTSSTQALENSLTNTKWTLESWVWNGDLQFSEGTFETALGQGRWRVGKLGQILLTNDYDPYSHVLFINGNSYSGQRSDGIPVNGQLNCGQLKDWDPDNLVMGDSPEENAIAQIFRELLNHSPDAQAFKYGLNLYRKGVSLQEIQSMIRASPEYTQLHPSSPGY
jgi:hypothetical protein